MDEILKWWPIITFAILVVLAIGAHHEKIKTMELKLIELFKLWNTDRTDKK
jgi:hypothetical protein